jgi:hypothetical protein
MGVESLCSESARPPGGQRAYSSEWGELDKDFGEREVEGEGL